MMFSNYGDRVAWKVGDLCAEEPGSFLLSLDIDLDNHAFYDEGSGSHPHSHEFCALFWRWGIWIALRAGGR
ncbi:hypothetical protein FGG24_gp60 [Mycobacterium phage JC27]|uniref:Uncharacterized protein n=1 Tax=Mycobacterium phage JC27 TaxID=2922210 RepID=G1D3A9_9CAUD|nr:hypothetical protein FGG24_gp60 [Mycobacterium phage JC27]AEK09255.1 hypothetical protein PBI_JC27_60 [Mycobacterium phage JC27]